MLTDHKFAKRIKYFLFTDNPKRKVPGWNTVVIDSQCEEPRQLSRIPKIRVFDFLPEFDEVIYTDTKEYFVDPVRAFMDSRRLKRDLIVPQHDRRNCVYAELDVVAAGHKIPAIAHTDLTSRYRHMGILPHSGLWACCLIYRRNTPEVVRFCARWWEEYSLYPYRDQPAFVAAVHATKIRLGAYPYKYTAVPWWKRVKKNKEMPPCSLNIM